MTHSLVLLVPRRSLSQCRTIPLLALFLFAAPVAIAQQDSAKSPGPGWVVIGLEEYKSLRAKAYPPEHEPEPPPVEATLSRVDYDLHVDGEFASGRAHLTIDVLKDGWARVPIPAGLLVREAKLDGKLVSLIPGTGSAAPGKSGSQLSAVLSHPGRSTLILDIVLPITANAGEESISLPPSVSGVTRATVELPHQGVDIRLTGGLLSERSESATSNRWVVYATGNAPLTFSWKRKTEDRRAELPLRLRGNLTQLLGLSEDAASLSAEVTLEIAQGLAHEVRLQIPLQITVNQVLGASVADWETKPGDKNSELTVTFLEPVDQSARFVISGEARLPRDGQIEIPLLKLLNAERISGGAAVEVLGAGEIKDVKTKGFENADASDLGELVANRQSPSLAAFRLRAGDAHQSRALTVNIVRYDQQAVLLANVEEARYRVLLSKEGKTLVEARYAIRNNQRNFVKIALPAGAILWSASLAGQPVRPGQAPDGSLLLPLEKSKASEEAPEFSAEIVYLAPGGNWADKGQAHLALPALDLPISRTGLQVYYPPLFRVATEAGSFRPETYTDPTSVALRTSAGDRLAVLESMGLASKKDRFNTGYGEGAGNGPGGAGSTAGSAAGSVQAGAGVGTVDGEPISGLPSNGRDFSGKTASPDQSKTLVDKYRSSTSVGRATGVLPLAVNFPAFGPSVFLVSELTGENHSATADFSYQQEKKGGSR
jgi:hypothetical protein